MQKARLVGGRALVDASIALARAPIVLPNSSSLTVGRTRFGCLGGDAILQTLVETGLGLGRRISWTLACLAATALVAAIVAGVATPARAIDPAEAAGPPFKIGIFVSSKKDDCYDSGSIAAIRKLATLQQKEINRQGGISGRPINLVFLDDERDQNRVIANMRSALAEPQMLAMIGQSNPTRAKPMFEALGDEIKGSNIPFISDISVNSLFAPFPNVFTTRASQDEDSLPIVAGFTRQLGFQRAAFVGLRDSVGGAAIGDGLKSALEAGRLIDDIRLAATDNKIDTLEIANTVAALKAKNPDLIYLYIGNANAQQFMKALVEAKLTPALFLSGRLDGIDAAVANAYPNALYNLGWDSPPEVYNNRLRKLITPQNEASWIFEGAKNAAAPGWTNGECKPRPDVEYVDPLNKDNLRALSTGSQFADMVSLIAEAARTEERTTDLARLRAEVVNKLSNTYRSGRGAFKGAFDTWSFVGKTRAAARDPFIMILPQGLGRAQLAPFQFVRSKDGSLRPMETLYVDVDLIRANRMNENEKTFFAEFYLSMRANDNATIDRLEFVNAYLDAQSSGGRQINVEVLHPGGASPSYPDSMRLYRVSGRFLFDPRLANFPFDTQRFAVIIQPKTGGAPFIVQPPPFALRDHSVSVDGWTAKDQYVGYDQEFVPVIDAYTHGPSVVPFYKTSFTWVMQRETTDYLLRVAVPLGFIMFVAYLSIFIPRHHFEAVVTIQVTALLSAVALYLSLPKIDSDTATISDRAFVFAYMVVSLMIGISILRVSPIFAERVGAERVLRIAHVVIIPLMVGLAAYFVYGLSMAGR